jgi:hypothetical protein
MQRNVMSIRIQQYVEKYDCVCDCFFMQPAPAGFREFDYKWYPDQGYIETDHPMPLKAGTRVMVEFEPDKVATFIAGHSKETLNHWYSS